MSREGKFMIYCTEVYKNKRNLSGKEVSRTFTHYGVWNYIISCFEALHTTSDSYIVNDIDLFIGERKGEV